MKYFTHYEKDGIVYNKELTILRYNMKQIDMVINWIKYEWSDSIYALYASDRYYGYTFYSGRKWDGMFYDDVEYLKLHYKHVIDIKNNYEVIK